MSRLSTKARRARRRRRAFQSYMAEARKIRARILAAPRATLLDFLRLESGPSAEVLELLNAPNPILQDLPWVEHPPAPRRALPRVTFVKIPRTP